mmetsp:Transcript_125457/g.401799  ORF Transcript_125457/g.401799 Transcript_125457/m.401799 type:complete len:221 (-) Transcript_125457:884-1546(-)
MLLERVGAVEVYVPNAHPRSPRRGVLFELGGRLEGAVGAALLMHRGHDGVVHDVCRHEETPSSQLLPHELRDGVPVDVHDVVVRLDVDGATLVQACVQFSHAMLRRIRRAQAPLLSGEIPDLNNALVQFSHAADKLGARTVRTDQGDHDAVDDTAVAAQIAAQIREQNLQPRPAPGKDHGNNAHILQVRVVVVVGWGTVWRQGVARWCPPRLLDPNGLTG